MNSRTKKRETDSKLRLEKVWFVNNIFVYVRVEFGISDNFESICQKISEKKPQKAASRTVYPLS